MMLQVVTEMETGVSESLVRRHLQKWKVVVVWQDSSVGEQCLLMDVEVFVVLAYRSMIAIVSNRLDRDCVGEVAERLQLSELARTSCFGKILQLKMCQTGDGLLTAVARALDVALMAWRVALIMGLLPAAIKTALDGCAAEGVLEEVLMAKLKA
jgi:hypothetical protein